MSMARAAYESMNDHALVDLANGGDAAAFTELAERHRENTYRLCLKMLGSPEDAEEHAQDALLKAFSALQTFRKESRFSTWLYRITRNVCLATLRKRSPQIVSLDEPIEMGGDTLDRQTASVTADPSGDVMLREFSALLEREVENLTARNREVFDLRVLQELSTDDTARILGLSRSSVKSRLHRARTHLWRELEEYLVA
jgi:RNA polymerase sigma-70 factor (ECF subfamily)